VVANSSHDACWDWGSSRDNCVSVPVNLEAVVRGVLLAGYPRVALFCRVSGAGFPSAVQLLRMHGTTTLLHWAASLRADGRQVIFLSCSRGRLRLAGTAAGSPAGATG
jgi:hypothetical protein